MTKDGEIKSKWRFWNESFKLNIVLYSQGHKRYSWNRMKKCNPNGTKDTFIDLEGIFIECEIWIWWVCNLVMQCKRIHNVHEFQGFVSWLNPAHGKRSEWD